MTEDGLPSPWWSVPQALIWIATRSEAQVLRANRLRTLAGVGHMTGIRSVSGPEGPPVSLSAAPVELVRAWEARRIVLYGRAWGNGPSRGIASRGALCLRDHGGEVCLGETTLYFGTRPFWAGLAARSDDCMRYWPVFFTQTVRTSQRLTATRRPSNGEVIALIEEKRKAFRAERKGAGRDVLLRAVMDHFGLSRKAALDIWNRTPRDRKGGRPRKARNLE